MIKTILKTTAGAILLGASSFAAAVTVDFESQTVGDVLNGVNLGGVTLSSSQTIDVVNGPNGTQSIRSNPFTGGTGFRADFDLLQSMVSVEMGDFGPSDSDTFFLQAYDASDNLLASDSAGPVDTTGTVLSVATAGIAYILFDGGSPSFPNSIFADNLTFDNAGVVPVPAALPLFGTFLAAVAFFNRRKRNA